LTVTLGGSIAELCSRSRLPLDWEFATDTRGSPTDDQCASASMR